MPRLADCYGYGAQAVRSSAAAVATGCGRGLTVSLLTSRSVAARGTGRWMKRTPCAGKPGRRYRVEGSPIDGLMAHGAVPEPGLTVRCATCPCDATRWNWRSISLVTATMRAWVRFMSTSGALQCGNPSVDHPLADGRISSRVSSNMLRNIARGRGLVPTACSTTKAIDKDDPIRCQLIGVGIFHFGDSPNSAAPKWLSAT